MAVQYAKSTSIMNHVGLPTSNTRQEVKRLLAWLWSAKCNLVRYSYLSINMDESCRVQDAKQYYMVQDAI